MDGFITAPKLRNISNEDDFNEAAECMSSLLSANTPSYDDVYAELAELNMVLSESATIDDLSREMQQVQALKDRVLQISQDANQNWQRHKRVVDILVKGWSRFAPGSSQDKREADAQLKMCEFILASGDAEALYSASRNIMRNLDSQHETISRQVTIHSLNLKYLDVRRYTPEDREASREEERRPEEVITDWDQFEE